MMTTARALVGRVLRPLFKAVEGQPRSAPFHLPITGGWLSAEAGQYVNWWQMGHTVSDYSRSAIVESCISSYAQTIASLSGTHWRANNRGGRSRVTNSALARILCVHRTAISHLLIFCSTRCAICLPAATLTL
jgi:hypothetical protein